jgi:TolB-like protein
MSSALLGLALCAAPRLAVLPLSHGEGVPDTTTAALTESLAAEVRKSSGADVITKREIESVLSLEMQKQMLGCQTDACIAELGGALGVDQLVTGDVARLGESWLVHLKVVKPAKAQVTAQSDRRIRGGTVDDVLDQLPAMVKELFPGSGAAAATSVPAGRAPASASTPPGPTSPAPPGPAAAAPALRVDQLLSDADVVRHKLAVFGDGERHVLAVEPFAGTDAPLLSGAPGRLYRARVVGGGRDGDRSFDLVFWDPRFPAGAQRSFSFRDGKATLSCGDREISFVRLGKPKERRVAQAAALLHPPWRRIPHALARDDEGTYYLLDGARGPDGNAIEGKGWALWVGPKTAMVPVEVRDVLRDGGGLLAISPAGKLKVSRGDDGKTKAEWLTQAGSRSLAWLEPSDHGPLLYGELSPYAGQPLGTPCDPYARR